MLKSYKVFFNDSLQTTSLKELKKQKSTTTYLKLKRVKHYNRTKKVHFTKGVLFILT
jgi:hypothetical protein